MLCAVRSVCDLSIVLEKGQGSGDVCQVNIHTHTRTHTHNLYALSTITTVGRVFEVPCDCTAVVLLLCVVALPLVNIELTSRKHGFARFMCVFVVCRSLFTVLVVVDVLLC